MKRRTTKILLFFILSALAVSGIMYGSLMPVRAERPSASEVGDSTLLIGTHLIYMLSTTPQIYEIAQASAESSGQIRIYYKSELDPGVWYDITDARTVYDFSSTQGKAVPDSVINGLQLTHHTKPDGKTYDLSTGEAVSPVSIVDPYDIYHLPELEGLKSMYESYLDMESRDKTTRTKMAMLKNVLFAQVEDSVTEAFDRKVEGMDGYLLHLRATGKPDAQILIASELQVNMDNGRRENVYRKVFGLLQEQVLAAGQTTSSQENVLSDLCELMNSAQSAVENTRTKYEAGMLAAGTALESSFRYETSTAVVQGAAEQKYAEADKDLEKLEDLENIDLKQISNRQRERSLADNLRKSFYQSYLQRMAAGQWESYTAAKEEGNPQSVLSQLRSEAASEYRAYRVELQGMIEAVLLRTEEDEKVSLLQQCMNEALGLKPNIKADDFADLAVADGDQLQEFMRDMLASVYKEQSRSTEVQKLQDQLKKLQDNYQEALTANDFDTAVALENQISSLSRRIEEKNQQLAAEVNQLQQQADSLDGQISAAQDPQVKEELMRQKASLEAALAEKKSQMSSNEQTATRTVGELTRKAVAEIQSGNLTEQSLSTIRSGIDGLAAYMGDYAYVAYPAMEKIKEAFDARIRDSGPLDHSLLTAYHSVSQMLDSFKERYEKGTSPSASPEELEHVIQSYFGKEGFLGEETAVANKQNAIAAAALELLCRYPDGQAEILLPGQKGAVTISGIPGGVDSQLLSAVTRLTAQDNPAIYSTLFKFGRYYAPIPLIAEYTPYRIVTDGQGEVQILAKGSSYYRFTHGLYQVEQYKSAQILTAPVLRYGQLYVDGTYLSQEFGLYIVSLESVGRCILADESMIRQIRELYSLMAR